MAFGKKWSRVGVKPMKDKKVFTHTAAKGKAINVKPRNARGGTYL